MWDRHLLAEMYFVVQQIKNKDMGKSLTLFSAIAFCVVSSMPLSAETTDTGRFVPVKQKVMHRNLAKCNVNSAKFSPKTLIAKAEGKAEAILIDEDFSHFTSGTVNKPDTTQMLACDYEGYSKNGIFIDDNLTNDGTWWGSQVYSAGGAACIKTYNPLELAYICTPLGDYSGDITVTLKAKALPDLMQTADGYVFGTGSSLYIAAFKGGYGGDEVSDTDQPGGIYDVRLYEKDGWQKITYTFKNYSADNDGYLIFSTEGSVVLDDIQVTTGSSFLARPVIEGITDFKNNQFTVAWQPTRKAFDYYVDLYTKRNLSDKDTVYNANFDDAKIPQGFETTSADFSDNEGANSTKALVLKNGDSFTCPTNGSDYKSLHFYLKMFDDSVDPSDPYAMYYMQGLMNVETKTERGWKEIGSFYLNTFWNNSGVIELEKEYSKFADDHITQIRFTVTDLNEGSYVVLDNVDITAMPEFVYDAVLGENSMEYGGDYNYYDSTDKTSFTFTGLDPNTEYYYGVRAHYVKQFSPRNYIHALGVAVPKAVGATDIDSRGSFTANWESVPKATGYTVTCYGQKKAERDNAEYPVLDEDFSKIDESVTGVTSFGEAEPLNNQQISRLDAYTKNPGWTGSYNTLVQGMLGAEGDYTSVAGQIITPELDLTHDSFAKVYTKIIGEQDDKLLISVCDKWYMLNLPDNGLFEGSFTVPVTKPTPILFYSYQAAPFAIDYLKVTQNVKKGDLIRTWIDAADVEGSATSYVFTGLDAYPFSEYAYNVMSHFKYSDIESVSSTSASEFVVVDLEKGTSGINDSDQDLQNLKIVARYTADGQLVSAPVKGLNILKMSNGKIIKVIVK